MFILDRKNSIANSYLSQLRDLSVQNDRQKFRVNLQRLGSLMAFEISQVLHYHSQEVSTPLGKYQTNIPINHPVLLTLMRAGLPFFQGFLDIFDQSECGFVGSFRSTEGEKEDIEIKSTYLTAPDLNGKQVILIDPMLATGKSLVDAVNNMKRKGVPEHIHIAAVISAPEGIEYIKNNLDIDYSIWTASLDEHLNNKAYIVPGLGDAGDLAFGPKLDN